LSETFGVIIVSPSISCGRAALRNQHRDLLVALKRKRSGCRDHLFGIFGPVEPEDGDAHDFQRLRGRFPHRDLPRIELRPFAAHRHQGEERNPAARRERQHIHAVADAARLHQQHRAVASEPGARAERDPFFFGGQDGGLHRGIAVRQLDELRVTGIRDIANL
jgi:hypothetical protein